MTTDKFGLVMADGEQIPLAGVSVSADIVGRSSRVRVAQKFFNNEQHPVEAAYKFPLPQNSAICGFRALVGDRSIKGEIEEREAAFKLYDDAVSAGDGAYLLDQERPNIFTLSVGNLNPGGAAIVEIEYVGLLETEGGNVRFYLPTTISPRYIPPNMPDKDGIPEDELVNPEFRLDVPYGLQMAITVRDPERISSIESPSHKVSTIMESESIRVELSGESVAMDRDVVLNIRFKDNEASRGYFISGKDYDYLQVDFCPKPEDFDLPALPVSNKEVIFVLDCSGSMNGSSIEQAKKAIEIFLRALPQGIKFNVYRFGTTFEKLFDQSKEYSTENITLAIEYIKKIDADLGGTIILSPLMDIVSIRVKELRGDIILITDGEVGNEDEVISLAQKNRGELRYFLVGIGYGPNDYFVRQVAVVSGGSSTLIAPRERIEPKVLGLFGKVMSASITDIRVSLPDAEQSPKQPSAFLNENTSIFFRARKQGKSPGKVVLEMIVGTEKRTLAIDITELPAESPVLRLMWARERMRALERGDGVRGSSQQHKKDAKIKDALVQLSKDYGLICRETSFVGVEKREGKDLTTETAVLRKVPVMLTRGWGRGSQRSLVFHRVAESSPMMLRRPVFPNRFEKKQKFDPSSVVKLVCKWFNRQKVEDAGSLSPAGGEEIIVVSSEDKVLTIIALQRPDGGFNMNVVVADMIGLTQAEINEIAQKLQLAGRGDREVLVNTALALGLLGHKFIQEKALWETVVSKSAAWLKGEVERLSPTYEGLGLEEWVDKYMQKKFGQEGLML